MLFLILLLEFKPIFIKAEMSKDSKTSIEYPYKPYNNSDIISDNVMRPNIAYPANDEAIDEATISVAQMISLNELSGSYFHYTTDETKKQSWAAAAYSSYTLLDWRSFESTIKNNIHDVFKIESDTIFQQSKFEADIETKRAINMLGNKAFIPESLDVESGQSYINEISYDTIINKTEALVTIYKAVGVECFMPPIIAYGNLDGQIIEAGESGKKEMKYTSLASMEQANRYAYYSVQARNARNYIYQSSNLVEGYLWQALQDGIISADHLNETALKFVNKYQSGEFSQPISSGSKKLVSIKSQEQYESPSRYSLAYLVGINSNNDDENSSSYSHTVCRYQQPHAFKNESISLLDFCVFVAQAMHEQGEPVLTDSEQKILTAAYSSSLPSTMSTEYYDTMIYLVARGIIDDNYTAEQLYQSLTWKDMYILLSRVADKNSRLTYKNVTVPFDLEMAEDGFIPVVPKTTEIKPIDIENNLKENTYKDIYIIKDNNTMFIDRNGKEDNPFISKLFQQKLAAYGVLMNNNYDNGKYYWFRIYYNEPIPFCYKEILDENGANINTKDIIFSSETKEKIHCYTINSSSTNKILYIENNSCSDGIYEYDTKDKICKLISEKNQMNMVSLSGINNIMLTSEEEKSESQQKNVLFTFKLKNNINLDKLTINGIERYKWISIDSLTSETELLPPEGIEKSKAVWVQYSANETKFAFYVEGNAPDNYEAIVSSKIQYSQKNNTNNFISYIKRNSTRDVYYSLGFLKQELGAVLSVNENGKSYTLQMPNEEILIEYKESSGWLCYSGNSLLKFNSSIPAIKEMDRQDTTDRYLIHGLVIEHYLRSNYKKGWSAFIGTDGYLHISSEETLLDMPFQNTDATINNFLTPTEGISYIDGAKKANALYEYKGQNTYWLDLRSIPSPLSNYIIFWEIGGRTEAKAGIVSFVPMLGDETQASTDILKNLLSLSSIKLTQSNLWGLEYQQAMKFGSSFSDKEDDTTTINGWTLSNLLRYDDKTFTLLYQIPKTDEIKFDNGFKNLFFYKSNVSNVLKWRLPYVYESEINKVWFMNLPLLSDFTVYKEDVKSAYNKFSNLGRLNTWVDKVIETCIDNNSEYVKAERKWYPIMPLSDLFITQSKFKENPIGILSSFSLLLSQFGANNIVDNSAILVGPYQLNIKSPITETLDVILNDGYDTIPQWAGKLYFQDKVSGRISSNSKTYSIKIGNTTLFLPAKNTLELENSVANNSLQQVGFTASKLNTSFIDGIKDFLNIMYLEEKELDSKFKNANGIVSLCYIFTVTVVPRILFGTLFLFQILSLLVNIKFIQIFCEKVFDFYSMLTFGRMPYFKVQPLKVWITGTIGSIIIILLSRDYGSYILAKCISFILNLLSMV